jgi:hypothetical protein
VAVKVLVTMGYFDAGGDGCLWGVDLASGRADLLLRYTPPAALRVPTRGFTGGCWGPDGALYVAGHAAVFRVDPAAWTVDGVLHVPSFNDLHHVAADGALLVTCLNDGSIREVMGLSTVVRMPGVFPHDGLLRPDGLWFTSIDGGIWRLPRRPEAAAEEAARALDVFESTGHWGWCRGLWMDGETLAVGLTEVRPDRLPRHRWSERPAAGSETSVLWIDRAQGTLRGRVDLTDRARHSKIYSVLPWSGR